MTLVDAKNAVLSHFLNAEVFSTTDDLASIQLDDKDMGKELSGHKEKLVAAALLDLVRLGLITDLGSGMYILSQPIDSFIQPVTLTPIAAEMVTDIVNEVCEPNDGKYRANKMALTSFDIEEVCRLCHFLLDEGNDGDEDDNDRLGRSGGTKQ